MDGEKFLFHVAFLVLNIHFFLKYMIHFNLEICF